MNISFSTSNKQTALGYIQQVRPSLTEEQIPLLLSLIERDILRVQDPLMYGKDNINVVTGTKYESKYDEEIDMAVNELYRTYNEYNKYTPNNP